MTDTPQTEDQLVSRAQQALSSCNWTIGECATEWTQRYAKGRTDADFGQLIGLSADQVYQRRRTWDTFSDVYGEYTNLKWSHFYVALNWDDAAECLQWANEIEATVAEMKAWRRAQRGEDLSIPAEDDAPFDLPCEFLTASTGQVRDANLDGYETSGEGGGLALLNGERSEAAMAANRQTGGDGYAPFNPNARGSAPQGDDNNPAEATTEQVVKRICSALERADKALTPQVLEELSEISFSLQQRLSNACENLHNKLSRLSD